MLIQIIIFLLNNINGNEDAKRLYDDLMVNYNRHRRPAISPNEPTTIKLKLRLSQIIDVVRFFPHKIQYPLLIILSMKLIKL